MNAVKEEEEEEGLRLFWTIKAWAILLVMGLARKLLWSTPE
jgi:hypothetical protein